ncbi:tetratricopeptide repeat protein [Undibacterium cyanobacteriorum]|uniref:Tetratricopeptide repeat protein n=1 Tax=Undibacterium cyanobacteriorum TaxID=3073561 RepID=A0ABY9RG48_9BURK|nr:tetratricopeptide repeat protein [Undibacterium sp. 20NA77.5]WMW80192.1 tetratricopeptide repeat protein [Undibacterium sp. 20NA77.5]
MKSLLQLFLMLSLTGWTLLCRADDFSDGVSLYEQRNFSAAAAAFKKAADQGKSDAQFNLGLMYLKGEGVTQDYVEAKALFEKAAQQNNVRAQVNLGRMYAKAKGVAPNYGMAVHWFSKAAELGYADAQYSLGVLYVSGHGVTRDYDKARDLFSKAAEQKNASAQYQLGLMYFKGKGVAIDNVAALKWLILAGDYEDAVTYRKYVESQMSKAEIEEAKKDAAEMK